MKNKQIGIVEEGFLDCGATGRFIDQNYTKDKGLKTEPLKDPIKVYNVDGTLNKRGTIRQYVGTGDLDLENACSARQRVASKVICHLDTGIYI